MFGSDLSKRLNTLTRLIQLVKAKHIIFRPDGLIVFRRGSLQGLEVFADPGTIALLTLIRDYNFEERELVDSVAELVGLENLSMVLIDRAEKLLQIYEGKYIPEEWWHPSEARYPNVMIWEITWSCNLRCVYCYANAVSGYTMLTMDLDKAKQLIDKVSGKILQVWIGGGEPTLHPRLVDILSYLRRHDFYICISTNGIVVSNNKMLLKKIGEIVDEVHIPLDGSKPEIHNRLRGGFNEAVKAIESFVKLEGPLVAVTTTVSKINIDDVPNIIELAASLGAQYYLWGPLVPCGRGTRLMNLVPSTEDLMRLYTTLLKKKSELAGKITILTNVPGVTTIKLLKPTMKCGAVNYYITVHPNGDVFPCLYLRDPEFKMGNLLESDLDYVLNSPVSLFFKEIDSIVKLISKFLKVDGKCLHCELFKRGYCNTGCKVMKMLFNRSILEPFVWCSVDIESSPLHALRGRLVKEGNQHAFRDSITHQGL
ncbi:MAG: hypothetical protein DRO12_03880 [Thermoprotei archaeon]|nr:MAG: hypothetical protein DRO12_03880 [Thermoprotei archaeon]